MVRKNNYKQYPNKSSGLKRYSRYVQGGLTEYKTDRIGYWDRNININTNGIDDIVIDSLEPKYEYRPDLLAFDLYGRTDVTWIILQYNNIVDLQDFVSGISLILPSSNNLFNSILNKSVPISQVTNA